jgi:hypothetical protein
MEIDIPDVIFLPAPVQSERLNMENIPPPNAISSNDLNDPARMAGLKRESALYADEILIKKAKYIPISRDDVHEAEEYRMGCNVAALVPKIVTAVPNQQIAGILEAIHAQSQMTNLRFEQMNQRFEAIEARLKNSSAFRPDDVIYPPQRGAAAPADFFPTTLLELRNLVIPGDDAYAIETYYGLPHTNGRDRRLERIQRAYGIGITSVVATLH